MRFKNNNKYILVFITLVILIVIYFFFNNSLRDYLSIQKLNFFYSTSPILFVLIFCITHLVASSLGIPGGCTFLNIMAGYLFGFEKAIVIIYPITLLSGICLYLIGKKANFNFDFINNQQKENIKKVVHSKFAFYFLVLLRLSPFLPYNLLNLSLGYLNITFRIFIFSTIIGIFFDVIMLTGAGHNLRNNSLNQNQLLNQSIFIFIIIILLTIVVHAIVNKFLLKKFKDDSI